MVGYDKWALGIKQIRKGKLFWRFGKGFNKSITDNHACSVRDFCVDIDDSVYVGQPCQQNCQDHVNPLRSPQPELQD